MTRDLCSPSRRSFLGHSLGLGGLALTWLLHRDGFAAETTQPHFAPKAKRVLLVFCPGGVSHVDTFDYKPELEKQHGKPLGVKIDTFFGQPGNLMKSPFAFKRHGQSGHWVSDLFPHLSQRVDDLTFIHSMQAKSSNHTPAGFQMLSGFTMNGFPCMGSWVSYGLGSENENLPAFVVLPDPRGLPAGGAINWTNGFLPATHQGVAFRTVGDPVPDLSTPKGVSPAQRSASLHVLEEANGEFLEATPGDSTIAARLRSYELAARMQLAIPEVMDLSGETQETKRLYGMERKQSEAFGRNCLLARRLLERGVRFVQLFHGGAFGSPRINWDAHEDIVENHRTQALVADQPLAGLLHDVKRRGMLDDTLVVWATEFGRTPITQGLGAPGRDHHPQAFTVWLAGAGLKRGYSHGKTDDVGFLVAENKTSIYDLHATVLHLLGIEHTKLTYYHNGIRRRLTDVHGEVVRAILA
jgi:Protein of unknown function (DUF1501)